MERLQAFEREGEALVWRRKTSGCMAAFGWLNFLGMAAFGVAGLVALAQRGEPLGGVFALVGLLSALFGLTIATARSEVRVTRHEARVRRVLLLPSETRVAISAASAVVATRQMTRVPQGQHAAQTRYSPVVSVGLLCPDGVVFLAAEHEDASTEGSVRAALGALSAHTGLPIQDRRQSADVLLDLARSRSATRAIVGVLVGLALSAALVVGVWALHALQGGAAGPAGRPPAARPRGR
jgi:hypothetical protein